MAYANYFLMQAFEDGHIVEVLLGDQPYFIRDRIDPRSPDRDLIVNELLKWAGSSSRGAVAAQALERAVAISLARGDIRGALDILLSYELAARFSGVELPVDVSKLVQSIHQWLTENREAVVNELARRDQDLLYFVRNMVRRFPKLGEGLEVFAPEEANDVGWGSAPKGKGPGYDSLADFRSGVREVFARTLQQHALTDVDAAEVAPSRYVVVLALGPCRLRVFLNLGDVEISVGRETAPLTTADVVQGEQVWYSVQPMIALVVDFEHVDWDEVFSMDPRAKVQLFAEWLALSMNGWKTLDGWCLEAMSRAEDVPSPVPRKKR